MTEHEFSVRPMGLSDIPAVVTIDRLSFPTPWPASSYVYELTESRCASYHVLVRNLVDEPAPAGRKWYRWVRDIVDAPPRAQVTGYVGLRLLQGAEAHVSTLAVHPDWRGKGLGELLLLVAVTRAFAARSDVITLEVRASNLSAQRLYDKYGFLFTGVRPGYYRDGEDALLMKVDLGSNGYGARLTELRLALEQRLRSQDIGVGHPDWGGL